MAETRQALTNMGHILKAANCTFNNVVKTTVLMADMKVALTKNLPFLAIFDNHHHHHHVSRTMLL